MTKVTSILNQSKSIKTPNRIKRDTKYTNMPLRDFLTEIGVFKKDRTDGSYKLTAGGLLFFGKYNSIISRYPKFQLDYFEKDNSLSY